MRVGWLVTGLGGPMMTVAMLSLAFNLVLTGAFIFLVKRLLSGIPVSPERPARPTAPESP